MTVKPELTGAYIRVVLIPLNLTLTPTTTKSSPMDPLADFSACELSDALIKLQVAGGGHIPDIVSALPPARSDADDALPASIRGPAYTVRMVMTTNMNAPTLTEHFVDTARPNGCIIVIDAPRGEWLTCTSSI